MRQARRLKEDFYDIDPFDTHIAAHLFLPAETKIGSNKSRDLFRPIAVASCMNKLISICMSKWSILSNQKEVMTGKTSRGITTLCSTPVVKVVRVCP